MASRTNKAVLFWLAFLSPLGIRIDISQLHCEMQSSATIMQSLLHTNN
jgi:hypothetical protein